MKEPYMHTIIGFLEGTMFSLSYFNFMTLRLGFLKVIYSGWVTITPAIFILEEELI